MKSFSEVSDDLELCHDCPVYPICVRLKKCEEDSICFRQIRDGKIRKVKQSMLATYEKWKQQTPASEMESEEFIDIAETC